VKAILKLAPVLRRELDLWRRKRAVGRLNACAARFGFGPLTEQEWVDGMGRLSGMVRKIGLAASDVDASLMRAARLLRQAP
jgi:hypothetical protein